MALEITKAQTRHFNSTMVRLKEYIEGWDGIGWEIFQFHYGTIKSFISKVRGIKNRNFNSTMVRLKVDGPIHNTK